MREITTRDHEMVSGGFNLDGAVLGGICGASIYISGIISTDSDGSPDDFVGIVVTGAVIGGLLAPAHISEFMDGNEAALVPGAAFFCGAVGRLRVRLFN